MGQSTRVDMNLNDIRCALDAVVDNPSHSNWNPETDSLEILIRDSPEDEKIQLEDILNQAGFMAECKVTCFDGDAIVLTRVTIGLKLECFSV